MEKQTFSAGGFVLHKVPHPQDDYAHMSAWYDASGRLLDAEVINRQSRQSRALPRNASKIRARLQLLGNVWK